MMGETRLRNSHIFFCYGIFAMRYILHWKIYNKIWNYDYELH